MKGWHTRREQGASPEVPGVTRRTLARSTAWAAPVLVTAVAAPAYAASGPCVPGTVTLTQNTSTTQPTTRSLQIQPSTTGVTATATFSSTGWGSDPTPGETGQVRATQFTDATAAYPNFNYLKLHHPQGMDRNDTVTLTITFSRAVTGLTLTITDIDKDVNSWIDEVWVTPGGFTTAKQPNSYVIGAGTSSATPFTSNHEGGVDSIRSDVTLTWSVAVQQVVITYRAADFQNQSGVGQHIGVGKIGFAC